jgi:magnesium chelatase family protein
VVVAVRVWGVVDDRLIELRSEPGGVGLRVAGLPGERSRTTADRVGAALVNSGLTSERPSLAIRLDPSVGGGSTSALDLAIALAALAAEGVVGIGLGWVLGVGRLGLDGTIFGPDGEVTTLRAVAGSLCHTPVLASEHMFER